MNFTEVREHLLKGGIFAYPTETVWGLGVDCTNSEAVNNLFELKGRMSSKAMSVLVGNIYQARNLAVFDSQLEKLLEIFWPGPVTFVLPAKDMVSKEITADSGFVGIRCSSHPFVRRLMQQINLPITTTSANQSGEPPAKNKNELNWLPTNVMVADSSAESKENGSGTGSTVVKIFNGKIECLRAGDIDPKLIEIQAKNLKIIS